jgi:hypothetical protein
LELDVFSVVDMVLSLRASRITEYNSQATNRRHEVETIVEPILQAIAQAYEKARKADEERLLKIIASAELGDCSEEMLERASELLARAAIARRKRDEEDAAKALAPPTAEVVFANKPVEAATRPAATVTSAIVYSGVSGVSFGISPRYGQSRDNNE